MSLERACELLGVRVLRTAFSVMWRREFKRQNLIGADLYKYAIDLRPSLKLHYCIKLIALTFESVQSQRGYNVKLSTTSEKVLQITDLLDTLRAVNFQIIEQNVQLEWR